MYYLSAIVRPDCLLLSVQAHRVGVRTDPADYCEIRTEILQWLTVDLI